MTSYVASFNKCSVAHTGSNASRFDNFVRLAEEAKKFGGRGEQLFVAGEECGTELKSVISSAAEASGAMSKCVLLLDGDACSLTVVEKLRELEQPCWNFLGFTQVGGYGDIFKCPGSHTTGLASRMILMLFCFHKRATASSNAASTSSAAGASSSSPLDFDVLGVRHSDTGQQLTDIIEDIGDDGDTFVGALILLACNFLTHDEKDNALEVEMTVTESYFIEFIAREKIWLATKELMGCSADDCGFSKASTIILSWSAAFCVVENMSMLVLLMFKDLKEIATIESTRLTTLALYNRTMKDLESGRFKLTWEETIEYLQDQETAARDRNHKSRGKENFNPDAAGKQMTYHLLHFQEENADAANPLMLDHVRYLRAAEILLVLVTLQHAIIYYCRES